MVDRSLRRFQNELSDVAELRTRADIRKKRSVEPSYACQAVSNSLRHLRAQTGQSGGDWVVISNIAGWGQGVHRCCAQRQTSLLFLSRPKPGSRPPPHLGALGLISNTTYK